MLGVFLLFFLFFRFFLFCFVCVVCFVGFLGFLLFFFVGGGVFCLFGFFLGVVFVFQICKPLFPCADG